MAHKFHHTVLREYDIRGIIDETLSAQDAYAIGRGFGTEVIRAGGDKVCVGYDGRLSSPAMEAALVQGLADAGIKVKRIGRGPTPMLYYATKVSGAMGGIMITGSHNPPNHNGFKMMQGGRSYYGEDIKRLGRLVEADDFVSGKGEVEDFPVTEEYIARVVKDYDGNRPLKVVWDAGNGATGEVMTAITSRLPGTHILLNAEIDGTFPAHHPDPTEAKNLKQLQDVVLKEGADLGIAFDGDGDRIGIIDGKARILWGDQILTILAEDVLKQKPGAIIIADVKASQVLFSEVKKMGGEPMMWRTGHSLIKSRMAETGAPLAGEMSGHIFFADKYYGFDDALYAAVRFLGIASRNHQESVAGRFDRLPKMVNTPELRFPCPDERKFQVIDEVKARLEEAKADFNGIDGVRVQTSDGWWLLRASNTQAVLVARCEASDNAGLESLKAALGSQLKESGLELPTESTPHH